jgi:SnoaL-like protein
MTTTVTDHLVALDRLQRRYADVITRRAWTELPELFLPDTVVHLDTVTAPPRDLVGPTEFAEVIGAAMARFDHFTFTILNAVSELDDPAAHDRTADGPGSEGLGAHGRIFLCEIRHEPDRDAWSTAHGVYQDRYVLVDGRWRIAERHYRSMARTGPDEAILGLPPDLGPLGR